MSVFEYSQQIIKVLTPAVMFEVLLGIILPCLNSYYLTQMKNSDKSY